MALGSSAEFSIIVKLVDQVTGKMGGLTQKFQGLGQSLTGVGKRLTTGLTLPLIGLGAVALKLASDFDASMRNVNSIAQLPEGQFKSLSDSVLQFALTTRSSSTDVANALYDVVSAGFDTEKGFVVMQNSSKLAEAGLADITDTTKLLIAAMFSYGKGVEEAGHLTDG